MKEMANVTYVNDSVVAQNSAMFDKVIAEVMKGATATGAIPGKIITGTTDELSRGVSTALTNIGTGAEQSLTSTAYGIKAIGEIGLGQGIGGGLREIGTGLGSGLGTGLENIGTGAGKGLTSFATGSIPFVLIAVAAILLLGLAKGVVKI